jgi:hypothetical protein
MFRPLYTIGAVLSLGTLSACNDSNGNFVHVAPTAVVRFINATDTPISVLVGGVLDTINASLPFGRQSACLLVNLNATQPITFTNGLTHVTLTIDTSNLFVGGNFTIIAFADLNGVIRFASLVNSFQPATGFAGVRFFNAAPTSGSVAMFGNTIQLTQPVSLGGNSGFFSLAATPVNVTFRNTTFLVLDAGPQTFLPNQLTTIVLGSPPITSTAPFRFFIVPGC